MNVVAVQKPLTSLEDDVAATIGAKATTLDASHVPQQSQQAEVASVILEAVNSAK